MTGKSHIILFEQIERCICLIRGRKVMLSTDLASLYGVQPRALVQAVKRNPERFPDDFMFHLTPQEFEDLKSQSVTSSWGGIRRATPYAFTEQGVAMLSSVLHSRQAIVVNIAIMRAFVRLREFLTSQAKLSKRLRDLERQMASHNKDIGTLFEAMQQLTTEHPPAIGYQFMGGNEDHPDADNKVRKCRAFYRLARKRKP